MLVDIDAEAERWELLDHPPAGAAASPSDFHIARLLGWLRHVHQPRLDVNRTGNINYAVTGRV